LTSTHLEDFIADRPAGHTDGLPQVAVLTPLTWIGRRQN
jgi:hypothetical protein